MAYEAWLASGRAVEVAQERVAECERALQRAARQLMMAQATQHNREMEMSRWLEAAHPLLHYRPPTAWMAVLERELNPTGIVSVEPRVTPTPAHLQQRWSLFVSDMVRRGYESRVSWERFVKETESECGLDFDAVQVQVGYVSHRAWMYPTTRVTAGAHTIVDGEAWDAEVERHVLDAMTPLGTHTLATLVAMGAVPRASVAGVARNVACTSSWSSETPFWIQLPHLQLYPPPRVPLSAAYVPQLSFDSDTEEEGEEEGVQVGSPETPAFLCIPVREGRRVRART